jgi:hypothetical protein
MVSSSIDGIRGLTVVRLARVNRAPLPIPHAQTARVHPLPLLFVTPVQPSLLLVAPHVLLGRSGEPEACVIMDGIAGIVPVLVRVPKVGKVGREGVRVKEEGVIWVGGPDDLVDVVVERNEAGVLGVGGLVEGVVARDPLVVLVVLCELAPEPEDTVLEILVVPDW